MPAKKKKLIVKVDIPIYHHQIVASNDADALVDYVREVYKDPEIVNHVDEFVHSCMGCFIHFETPNGHQALLLLAPNTATLCHESVHAAWGILDHAGVKVKAKNHEALAYLTGFIFEECHRELGLK
tara:strand:- start:6481 stop:6858 length:378 start_codon:yes stop_codon:yes gene_type:complete